MSLFVTLRYNVFGETVFYHFFLHIISFVHHFVCSFYLPVLLSFLCPYLSPLPPCNRPCDYQSEAVLIIENVKYVLFSGKEKARQLVRFIHIYYESWSDDL
jgi:hypothetical protein